MIAVLDASAAIRVATGQDAGSTWRTVLEQAERVLVPELFVAEVTNTMWKLARHGGVDPDVAAATLKLCLALPDARVSLMELADEVFDLACRKQRPAYDLFYLVLARRHAAVLLTADRGLAALAVAEGVRV